ncbi:hypothetical protein ABKV19_013243 [Rosa sericea]
MKAYEPVINPIAGVQEWELIHRPIAPPLYRAQPGRPKTNRTKAPGEEAPPAGTEKLPRSYYSQVKCGRCHKKGHNVRTCLRRNQGNVENEQMHGNGGAVNQQQQPQAQGNGGAVNHQQQQPQAQKC